MIIRINEITIYKNLNFSKRSKYNKYNLIKLGWNKNGSLDLTGINLFNKLNKVKEDWKYFEFKYKINECPSVYVDDVCSLYEETQKWVHKKEKVNKQLTYGRIFRIYR